MSRLRCSFSDLLRSRPLCFFFFFNDTATTEIYTLSLHDALPIWSTRSTRRAPTRGGSGPSSPSTGWWLRNLAARSEEHTSELQSHLNLVCRLLLEKKKRPMQLSEPCGRTQVATGSTSQ